MSAVVALVGGVSGEGGLLVAGPHGQRTGLKVAVVQIAVEGGILQLHHADIVHIDVLGGAVTGAGEVQQSGGGNSGELELQQGPLGLVKPSVVQLVLGVGALGQLDVHAVLVGLGPHRHGVDLAGLGGEGLVQHATVGAVALQVDAVLAFLSGVTGDNGALVSFPMGGLATLKVTVVQPAVEGRLLLLDDADVIDEDGAGVTATDLGGELQLDGGAVLVGLDHVLVLHPAGGSGLGHPVLTAHLGVVTHDVQVECLLVVADTLTPPLDGVDVAGLGHNHVGQSGGGILAGDVGDLQRLVAVHGVAGDDLVGAVLDSPVGRIVLKAAVEHQVVGVDFLFLGSFGDLDIVDVVGTGIPLSLPA